MYFAVLQQKVKIRPRKNIRQPHYSFPIEEGKVIMNIATRDSQCLCMSLNVCPSTGHFREELSTDSSYTHLVFTEIVFKDNHNPPGELFMEQKHFLSLSSLVCEFFLLHLPKLLKFTSFYAPNHSGYSLGKMICPLAAGDMAKKILI